MFITLLRKQNKFNVKTVEVATSSEYALRCKYKYLTGNYTRNRRLYVYLNKSFRLRRKISKIY